MYILVPDLVIIKYFGNNTIEMKRIVFTYPDLLPSALVVRAPDDGCQHPKHVELPTEL